MPNRPVHRSKLETPSIPELKDTYKNHFTPNSHPFGAAPVNKPDKRVRPIILLANPSLPSKATYQSLTNCRPTVPLIVKRSDCTDRDTSQALGSLVKHHARRI